MALWMKTKIAFQKIKYDRFTVNVFLLTFLLVLPLLCRNLPHSLMYRPRTTTEQQRQQAVALNIRRADRYLNTLKTMTVRDGIRPRGRGIHLDILLITVKRSSLTSVRTDYLIQTAVQTELLRHKATDYFKTTFRICNTYPGPGEHEEAVTLTSHGFYVISRYPGGDARVSTMDKIDKEKDDYIYCLGQALGKRNFTGDKYLLVLEDDALMRSDFFAVLRDVIRRVRVHSDGPRAVTSQVAFIKLFYPARWAGYGHDLQTVVDLVTLAALGAGLARLVSCCRARPLRWGPAYGALYLVLLALVVGRQHLDQWRRLHPSLYHLAAAPGCCSPVVLFTHAQAAQFVTFTSDLEMPADHRQIDYAQDMFMRRRGHVGLLVQPSAADHIGYVSSLKTASSRPQDFL